MSNTTYSTCTVKFFLRPPSPSTLLYSTLLLAGSTSPGAVPNTAYPSLPSGTSLPGGAVLPMSSVADFPMCMPQGKSSLSPEPAHPIETPTPPAGKRYVGSSTKADERNKDAWGSHGPGKLACTLTHFELTSLLLRPEYDHYFKSAGYGQSKRSLSISLPLWPGADSQIVMQPLDRPGVASSGVPPGPICSIQ